MSRTYKYPREKLSDSVNRKEDEATLRIRRRLEIQKKIRKKKSKMANSLKKSIRFWEKQKGRN